MIQGQGPNTALCPVVKFRYLLLLYYCINIKYKYINVS